MADDRYSSSIVNFETERYLKTFDNGNI